MIRLVDFEAHMCGPETEIRDVMEQINIVPHQFQLVADGDGRLLGTVTDGDIRRAILRGTDLGQPVSACMHTEMVTGRLGQVEENKALLRSAPVKFLPVLDDQRRVVEVLLAADEPERVGAALVMAGGFGVRLGERTRATPKPLLSVAEKPILERVLSALEAGGFRDVFVSTHYLPEQIADFLEQRDGVARVTTIHEAKPLGTAGAIGCLPEPLRGPLLVMNGDVITSTDFVAMRDFHFRHGGDATIAVAQYEAKIPYGVVRYDDDGQFLGIDEKPMTKHFVAAGIYFLSPEFCALVPRNKPMDMPDLLNLGRGIGLRVGLFPIHEYWIDVGRPDDLDAADTSHQRKA